MTESTPQPVDFTEKDIRRALDTLSLKVFGNKNKWRKMMERGYLDPLPGNGPGHRVSQRKYYTRASLLVKLDEMLAAQKDLKK